MLQISGTFKPSLTHAPFSEDQGQFLTMMWENFHISNDGTEFKNALHATY